jgi:IS5 family transposase
MLLVDGRGIPLSIIVTAANHHDLTQLEPVLDAIVCRRPRVGSHAHRHKKRHPARRWVVEEDWTRKDLVPIEAVFASIEAKHTLEIEGESRSSLTHAFEQAGKVRALCEQRTQVPMNQIAPG